MGNMVLIWKSIWLPVVSVISNEEQKFDSDTLMMLKYTSTLLNFEDSQTGLLKSLIWLPVRKMWEGKSGLWGGGGKKYKSPTLTSDPPALHISDMVMSCSYGKNVRWGRHTVSENVFKWRHSGTWRRWRTCLWDSVSVCWCGRRRICLVCGFVMIKTDHNNWQDHPKRRMINQEMETNNKCVCLRVFVINGKHMCSIKCVCVSGNVCGRVCVCARINHWNSVSGAVAVYWRDANSQCSAAASWSEVHMVYLF